MIKSDMTLPDLDVGVASNRNKWRAHNILFVHVADPN